MPAPRAVARGGDASSAAGRSQHGSAFSSSRGEGGASLAQSAFARDFHERVVVPLLEHRRSLAHRGCLPRGAEVAPSSPDRAADLRRFDARCRQKLEARELVPLALHCGARLLELGEYATASRAFFGAAVGLCDGLLARPRRGGGPGGGDDAEVAAWRADAVFGRAECELARVRRGDGATRYPRTAQRLFARLRDVRAATRDLLALPPGDRDRASWLLLNGAGLLHAVAEPLAALGGAFARHAAEFLLWAARALDATVALATTKYLPARCRLYALICRACDDCGRPGAARAVADMLAAAVAELRAFEEMQLPLPRPAAENRGETNRRFGGSRPNFGNLSLGRIEVDSADFCASRVLSSSSRSATESSGRRRVMTRALKSG